MTMPPVAGILSPEREFFLYDDVFFRERLCLSVPWSPNRTGFGDPGKGKELRVFVPGQPSKLALAPRGHQKVWLFVPGNLISEVSF